MRPIVSLFPAVVSLSVACGARTDIGGVRTIDASAKLDAAPTIDAPVLCDFGTIVSDAFGATVLWNGGAPLPAGHYRVTYVDGCMKYAASQGWAVNAYANGPDTLFVVTNGDATVAPAPGTVGFFLGQGGFASFDACVSTNLGGDAPLEFDFGGGVLGLHLADSPYSDNVAGESGRNPSYHLSSCP